MNYVVTGATGFIGRFVVQHLLDRGGTVHAIVREGSLGRFEERKADWHGADRVHAVVGDIGEHQLGVSSADLASLRGSVDHVFHLAAVYDITADAVTQAVANVEGTRNAIRFAEAIEAKQFDHVSSIAAAGLFDGVFREDMFDEAENLDQNPYFRTKHESEKLVRTECSIPWRVYRPAIVVGHSKTGQIDKIDGPYYFFKLIQKIRDALPRKAPMIGVEGSTINMVPVDYVAAAIDHIAHQPDIDGQAFHLTDPDPLTVGQVLNVFAEAAHAPKFSMRIDAKMVGFIPKGVRKTLSTLPPVKRIGDNLFTSLQMPKEVMAYLDYPTEFDSRDAQAALEGSGISIPPLKSYAGTLWDYWERNLDPALFRDVSLEGAVGGRLVMITGASEGIGKETAIRVADAGGHVLLVARTRSKLETLQAEIVERGGAASVHPCDLSDMEDIDRMADEVIAEHGRVDILLNNAGRSIRRSIALSYDRFHDFERTMQLNYFGTVRLLLKLLPVMREHKFGHVVNVSSIGVQTNTPRFSAYVASKSAVDAFSRCIASEVIDDNVHITTVYMPLVRTDMIAPTKIYDAFPTKSVEEAAELITDAFIFRPKKVGTRLGNFGQTLYSISPKTVDAVLNQAYKLFPDSSAAKKGKDAAKDSTPDQEISNEALAFAHVMGGIHW